MCGKRLKYIKNGFTMFKMAEEVDNRLKYVANDVYMWKNA